MMATTKRVSEPKSISLKIPLDDLGKHAGLTALAMAVLGVAGVVATAAYLSAWGVPAPVIRLDPMTAALRSETVVYQFALLGGTFAALTWVRRRWHRRGRLGTAATAIAVVAVATLGVILVTGHAFGPAVSLAGGLLLFVLHQRAWLGDRGLAILFAVVAVYAAYETGFDSGVLVRDNDAWQTPTAITTRVPAAGLEGGIEEGGGFRYEGLYLVFRDGESIYVSRPGAGPRVWIVPSGNLMSLEIGAR